MSPWSGSRPLASAMPLLMGSHWGSCHSVSWRSCCFGFVGLSPAHAPTVDVGVGQFTALILGLGGGWVGQLASFSSLSLPG